jgi:hypothetical protein
MSEAPVIDAFIEELQRRPWLEADWIAAIEHGLRTAVHDPNGTLWQKLQQVIEDDELTTKERLTQIKRITGEHRRAHQARRAVALHTH